VLAHAMKTNGAVEFQLHTFLTMIIGVCSDVAFLSQCTSGQDYAY
jgi:hypothetical protein